MQLENSFDVPVPPADTWKILVDVERVAPCVPGAQLTEIVDDQTYNGKLQVKLGPVSLSFDGKATFVERDDDAFTARLSANGRESRGRGGADADVRFSLEPSGDGTTVLIKTDLQLSGPVAQYGRSQGIIAGVSEEMIGRFAACLKDNIIAAEQTDAAPAQPQDQPAQAVSGMSIGLGALFRMIRRFVANLFGKA